MEYFYFFALSTLLVWGIINSYYSSKNVMGIKDLQERACELEKQTEGLSPYWIKIEAIQGLPSVFEKQTELNNVIAHKILKLQWQLDNAPKFKNGDIVGNFIVESWEIVEAKKSGGEMSFDYHYRLITKDKAEISIMDEYDLLRIKS